MLRHRSLPLLAVLAAAAFTGCLGEPEVEERWTNLEFLSTSTQEVESYAPGDTVGAAIRARVTFRGHFIGFMVTELRVSHTLTADSLFLDDERDAIAASENVARLLQRSQPLTRTVRGMAGYPALRRYVETEFETQIPASVNGIFDRPGGVPRGLFLVLYMGDGEEIELEDGSDSLVVTPFDTREDEVLFKAIALPLGDGSVAP